MPDVDELIERLESAVKEEDKASIAELLREFLGSRNLSRFGLAVQLGVSDGAVGQWLGGKSLMRPSTIGKIKEAFANKGAKDNDPEILLVHLEAIHGLHGELPITYGMFKFLREVEVILNIRLDVPAATSLLRLKFGPPTMESNF